MLVEIVHIFGTNITLSLMACFGWNDEMVFWNCSDWRLGLQHNMDSIPYTQLHLSPSCIKLFTPGSWVKSCCGCSFQSLIPTLKFSRAPYCHLCGLCAQWATHMRRTFKLRNPLSSQHLFDQTLCRALTTYTYTLSRESRATHRWPMTTLLYKLKLCNWDS